MLKEAACTGAEVTYIAADLVTSDVFFVVLVPLAAVHLHIRGIGDDEVKLFAQIAGAEAFDVGMDGNYALLKAVELGVLRDQIAEALLYLYGIQKG